MQLIRNKAYARAGLIGNPSDGYNGKTISLTLGNLWSQVTLYEWDELEIVWSQDDRSRFDSIDQLSSDVILHGYYGGIRLVKATIKKFVDYCRNQDLPLHGRNFSVRYESSIPRQVGLAGSSAIIVATLRCLMEFYGIEIPLQVLPSLALSVETEELGISAGLQDRVVQVYGGVVYMDFAKDRMNTIHGHECGAYERLDPSLLTSLYVAYSSGASAPTEVVHNNLRARFDGGEQDVVQAMTRFGELTDQARTALLARDTKRLGSLIDANFDLRQSICRIPSSQFQMIECARKLGASAKFAGSGGAIIGTYVDDAMFDQLVKQLGDIHCQVIKPIIV
jgi:glucuronokinase